MCRYQLGLKASNAFARFSAACDQCIASLGFPACSAFLAASFIAFSSSSIGFYLRLCLPAERLPSSPFTSLPIQVRPSQPRLSCPLASGALLSSPCQPCLFTSLHATPMHFSRVRAMPAITDLATALSAQPFRATPATPRVSKLSPCLTMPALPAIPGVAVPRLSQPAVSGSFRKARL